MNSERIISAGIATIIIVAVGLSSSTLTASLSTDPADAVDVEEDGLPLGDDMQNDIRAVAQGVHDRYTGNTPSESGSESDDSGASARQAEQVAGAAGQSDQVDQADGQSGQRGESGQSGDSGQAAGGDDTKAGQEIGDSGWPRALLLVIGVLAAVVILAYRYRRRIRRVLLSVRVNRARPDPATDAMQPVPENQIEHAWVTLLRHAGIQRTRTRTPADCAQLAVEAGHDPVVVNQLRRAFEDVRYGAAPPTAQQQRLARKTLDQLDGERA